MRLSGTIIGSTGTFVPFAQLDQSKGVGLGFCFKFRNIVSVLTSNGFECDGPCTNRFVKTKYLKVIYLPGPFSHYIFWNFHLFIASHNNFESLAPRCKIKNPELDPAKIGMDFCTTCEVRISQLNFRKYLWKKTSSFSGRKLPWRTQRWETWQPGTIEWSFI